MIFKARIRVAMRRRGEDVEFQFESKTESGEPCACFEDEAPAVLFENIFGVTARKTLTSRQVDVLLLLCLARSAPERTTELGLSDRQGNVRLASLARLSGFEGYADADRRDGQAKKLQQSVRGQFRDEMRNVAGESMGKGLVAIGKPPRRHIALRVDAHHISFEPDVLEAAVARLRASMAKATKASNQVHETMVVIHGSADDSVARFFTLMAEIANTVRDALGRKPEGEQRDALSWLAARANRWMLALRDAMRSTTGLTALAKVVAELAWAGLPPTEQQAAEFLTAIDPDIARRLEPVFAKHVHLGQMVCARDFLHKVLVRRFGAVPPWAEERIAVAAFERLDEWHLRAVDSPSLEAVFDKNEPAPSSG